MWHNPIKAPGGIARWHGYEVSGKEVLCTRHGTAVCWVSCSAEAHMGLIQWYKLHGPAMQEPDGSRDAKHAIKRAGRAHRVLTCPAFG